MDNNLKKHFFNIVKLLNKVLQNPNNCQNVFDVWPCIDDEIDDDVKGAWTILDHFCVDTDIWTKDSEIEYKNYMLGELEKCRDNIFKKIKTGDASAPGKEK